MPRTAVDTIAAHDGLDCADVEALLNEANAENVRLNTRSEDLLHEAERLRALLDDMRVKMELVEDERDSLITQNQFLHEELKAANAAATPEDTLVSGVLHTPEVMAVYRQVSQVSRGPIPAAVATAVEAGHDRIRVAMERAGKKALTTIIREQVAGRARRAA